MPRIPNPYFAGPPATQPNTFFGRQDVLRFVDETLASPMYNVIVFHGQRRIGKTSILHQIRNRSGQDYQAVFFDLHSVANPAQDLFYELAREVAGQLEVPVPDRLDFQHDPDTFRRVFLPRVYERLGNRRLLLLLDEFDTLSQQTTPTEIERLPFVNTLNRIIQSDDKRVVFLFVIGRQWKELTSQQLQIFRVARPQQITLLRREDALQLIAQPAQGILSYEEAASERIWQLSNGHPYFTQLLCHEIFNQAKRQDNWTVTAAQVEVVIDDAIGVGQSALQWFWDEVSPVERFTLYTIGQLEAETGYATLDQLTTQRRLQGVQVTDFELRDLPDQLVSREVLKRDLKGHYRFAVELVRRWIVQAHSLEEVTTKLTRLAVDEEAKTFFKAGQQAYWAEETELAIKNFSRALSINANYVDARLWLARAYAKMDDLLAAINEFVNVERFGGPTQREVRLGLADVRSQYGQQLEEEGKIEEAIQEYKRVLELDSEHPLANLRLGQIFRDQADLYLASEGLAAAQSLYEQALRHDLNPDLEQAIKERLNQYSQTQEAANNWEEAERASRLAATLMSKTGENQETLLRVQLNWARWQLSHHELDTAARVYQRLLKENTEDSPRQMIENDILRYSQQQEEQNNWSQAEVALRLLVELFPRNTENQSRLADSLCRQGEFFLDQADMVKAKDAYERALDSAPRSQSLLNSIQVGFQSYHQARFEDRTVHTQKVVEAAMLMLTEILGKRDPLSYQWLAEARTNLGDAWQAEHDPKEAQAVYRQAVDDITHVLQSAPELDHAYHQRALLWLKLGQLELSQPDRAKFDEAVEYFQLALADARSEREMFIDQIKKTFNDYRRQQEEARRWNYAEHTLEILGRLFLEDEEAKFWLAESRVSWAKWHLQRSLPDLDEVQRLARRALDVNISRARFHMIIAWIKAAFQTYCLQQEQANPPNWAQAEQIMNNLVILLPDDPTIHRRLAETRANQGDWYLAHESQTPVESPSNLLKAAEVYDRALNDAPNDTGLIARLKESFRTYQRRQQQVNPPAWTLIEQSLQTLADLLPDDEEVRHWLAAETLALQATRLLQHEPADSAEARSYLAEARKNYEKALQITISDKTALVAHLQTSFRVYCQKQEQAAPPQWELAEEALAILVALLPEETETRAQRAEFYGTQADWLLQRESPDLTKVETVYRQALVELPDPRESLAARLQQSFRSYCLNQQQVDPPNWLAAEQALRVLATLLPDEAETHRQLTKLYTERGNWYLDSEKVEAEQAEAALIEAGRFYEQALETSPDDKTALFAQIKEGFNAYRLKQIQQALPRWLLAERALAILVELLPADEEVQGWLAELYLAQGQYNILEAQSISDRRRETEQAQKLEEAALAYEHAGVAAERRTQLAPMNPFAWQQLATAQAGLGRLCWILHDEQGALNAYNSALVNWGKAIELDADPTLVKEVAAIHLARGDILLQRGDLSAAEQDYLAANELSPHEREWLAEVNQRLQAYQARQKPLGIQRQVVAAGELRYRLQPDNPAVWRELAGELVTYGGEFLEDDQFELAKQRYEQAMPRRPQTPGLGEIERHRLSQIIRQDVNKFIQRQEQAGNRSQAEEARAWLATASFLTKGVVVPPRLWGYTWWWWSPIVLIVSLILCAGAAFLGPWDFSSGTLFSSQTNTPATIETPAPTPSSTPAIIVAAPISPPPSATATPSPTSTPTPAATPTITPLPTSTSIPTATPTSTVISSPTNTPTLTPPPMPSNTPTISSQAGPLLLSPEDGYIFSGASPLPRLEWSPISELGPDQAYVVKLKFLEQGNIANYPRYWRKDTFWEVPAEIFKQADPPERAIEWQVVVVQISPTEEIIKELDPPSETRTFTWQPIPLLPGEGLDVAINPSNISQTLVILKDIGIYKSDNDGIDWRKVSNETTLETLHFSLANPGIVYAGAYAQVLKSENGGETWQAHPLGRPTQVHAVATNPDNDGIIFVATDLGILVSQDEGQSWSGLDQADNQGGKEILNRPFYSLVTARTASQGSRVYTSSEGDQIYWRGASDVYSPWQRQVCRNACTPPIFALALDPQNSNKLLAGTNQGKLAISLNGGIDWNSATIPSVIPTLKFSVLKFDPIDPDIVYAGSGSHIYSGDGEGLYRSLDGGLTWHRFNTWSSNEGRETYIQGIAINPTDNQDIFIAGSEGVFRSTDGGNSWKKQ